MVILFMFHHVQIQGLVYHNPNFGGIFESGKRGALWKTISTLYG